MRRAFTLVELLTVIIIVGIVSAVALPTVMSGLGNRQISEGARILQGAIAGARDAAIRDNAPAGIRLLPDPTLPGAYARIVPLSAAPAYSTGVVACFPGKAYKPAVIGTATPLVLEEVLTDPQGLPNEPTSWYWNVRCGDHIQINGAGPWYSVCGPVFTANPESFVNIDRGTPNPLGHDYLLLTNGRDDDRDGYPDNAWDGLDNDGDGLTDETTCKLFPAHGEWEQETWQGALAQGVTNATYVVERRPIPLGGSREVSLPSGVVVDATTWDTTRERSRLPVDPDSLFVDIMISPQGLATPSTKYGVPFSFRLGSEFFHFWLADRADVLSPVGTKLPTLPVGALKQNIVITTIGNQSFMTVIPLAPYGGPYIKSPCILVTLGARTGRTVYGDALFDDPAGPKTGTYDSNMPYYDNTQGVIIPLPH